MLCVIALVALSSVSVAGSNVTRFRSSAACSGNVGVSYARAKASCAGSKARHVQRVQAVRVKSVRSSCPGGRCP